MTAIDWIHSKILLRIGLDDNDIIELRNIVKVAIEMEKEQIEKAYQKGFDEATTQGIKEAHKYQ